MVAVTKALSVIPAGLRTPLLAEYDSLVTNYSEQKWTAAELSGGKFCEIVYTILDGYAKGTYSAKPSKPANFVEACRRLENNNSVPRSFQILIPRLLPPLYEIRNNRNVGHVGGDVDPNHMDATTVLAIVAWVMAELVRVFHGTTVAEAQEIVDSIVERPVPLIWQSGQIKRVLDPKMKLREQVLVLIGSCAGPVDVESLQTWTECKDKAYFKKLIGALHKSRLVEASDGKTVRLLPPGTTVVAQIFGNHKGR
ncbi:hypothetical protein [uncultured Paludibaculum sp.]|uniref:hypothetical protein n=1 Tax=uncultured Paludibaculum sp. TaxID=1765020 RepID=UPI002AAC3A3D|nr:hypothetical protein [uncultured Paludibaculum sp.]